MPSMASVSSTRLFPHASKSSLSIKDPRKNFITGCRALAAITSFVSKPMEDIDRLLLQRTMEELYFALAGLDTDALRVEGAPARLVVRGLPAHLVAPFEGLVLRVREAAEDPACIRYVSAFLKRLCVLRTAGLSPEALYVALSDDRTIFDDLVLLRNGGASRPRSKVVDAHCTALSRRSIAGGLERWINNAEAGELVAVGPADGFDHCLWRDMFRLRVPGELKKRERRAAEDCGKIVYLLRNVFGTEAVADAKAGGRCELFRTDNLGASGSLPGSEYEDELRDDERRAEEEDAPVGNLNINDENYLLDNKTPAAPLRPYRFGDSIERRRLELEQVLNGLLLGSIRKEVDIVHGVLFLQNFSFYSEILHLFHGDLLSTSDETVARIGAFISENKKRYPFYFYDSGEVLQEGDPFCCVLSNVSLGEYILRLLKTQTAPQSNPHLTVLERLSVELRPRVLHHFVPPKIMAEIKIINRFLFLVNAAMHYLERSPGHSFTRVLYLLFMRVRDIPMNRIGGESVTAIAEQVEAEAARLIGVYSLTSADVFVHWASLLDCCLEYIQVEFKEDVDAAGYTGRVRSACEALCSAALSATGESGLTEFLQALDWDSYV